MILPHTSVFDFFFVQWQYANSADSRCGQIYMNGSEFNRQE